MRLRSEHEIIREVLIAVEGLFPLEKRRVANPTPPPLAGAVDFFKAFVERCHQAKEEQVLLPILVRRDVVDRGALDTIEREHAEARRLLRALRAGAGRRDFSPEVAGVFADYTALEQRHMAFEDRALLPMADALSPDDEVAARRGFDRIEERVAGPGGRDVLLALAGALTQACRALGAAQRDPHHAVVARDLIHPPLGTVAPGDSLSRAADLMESLRIRELAVVDAETLVGILSRSDLEPYRGHLEWTTVRTAMTPDPVTVEPDAPVRHVARTLLERDVNSVPVLEGGHRLVGMVRRSDLLRLLDRD